MKRRYILLVAANILLMFLVVAVYEAVTPEPPVVTQRDIDAAVERNLASATPQPSMASVVFNIIRPSLVRIQTETNNGEGSQGSIGAGVILDTDGMILSALHVVDDAETIEVVFADGFRTGAQIIEQSEENDIVVLQPWVIPDNIIPAVIAGSPLVGDDVFAVGNPYGIPDSVSAGVVSGLGRFYKHRESGIEMSNLIQFDAAVNPGNSGGPLLNRNGEVVGIVTSLLNPTEQNVFIGIGFAVPIETASAVGGEVPY